MHPPQKAINTRRASFLKSSPSIDGILDILQVIEERPKYAAQVIRETRITFKMAIYKYIKYCLDHNLIEQYREPKSGHVSLFRNRQGAKKYYTYYRITDNGRKILEIL